MSTKEDLLQSLSVKDLEELAGKYGISLVKGHTLLGGIIELLERVTRKSDIIDILHESATISKRAIQEFIYESKQAEDEKSGTELIGIDDVLKNMNKDALVDVCDEFNINSRGKKEVLVNRLIDHIGDDVGKVEQLLYDGYDVDELKYLLRKFNLPVSGKKAELVERIKDNLSISEEQIVPSREVALQRVAIKSERKDKLQEDYLLRLLKAIEEWVPRKRVGYEEAYQVDLTYYLEKCGFKTRMEKGEDLFDIIVDDIYPIELKKSPGRSEYDRLIGQISQDVRSAGQAIVVICDVKRHEEFMDFKQNLYTAYGEKVKIFKK